MPNLLNWGIAYTGSSYTAPEVRDYRLQGAVYGHPNFQEGDMINTSPITNVETVNCEKAVFTCKNRKYTVLFSDVDPNWVSTLEERGMSMATALSNLRRVAA